MRKTLLLVLLATGATALFAWTVLERKSAALDDGASPLAYAPADTPFVVGIIEPFPGPLVEQWVGWADPAMAGYAAQLRRGAQLAATGDGAATLPRLLGALADEIEGKTMRRALEDVGLAMDARFAVYGHGLVPVLRVELADVAAFGAFVARLETRTGATLAAGTVGAQAYWRLAIDDASIEAVAAVVGQHLVVSAAPVAAEPALLATLFGLEPPPRSVLDADGLDAVIERFDYLPHLIGQFDSARFVAALTGPPTPVAQAYLTALGIQPPSFDAACEAEFAALAAVWPRASFGYTVLESSRMEVRTVVEAERGLAADLMTLRAPLPALAAVGPESLFNLGLSLELDALPALVNRRAEAITSQPYACPALAGLNRAAAEAQTAINNPGVYAAAPVFRGFHLVFETIELDPALTPTAVSGALVIGSDNPQSLLSMAALAVPQVATLGLEPDGTIKPLTLPPIPGAPPLPAWASMTAELIGIGFGDGADRRLPGYLQSDAKAQPLLVLGYSGRAYTIMADAMERGAASTADPEARAELERQAKLMREVYARWFDRTDLRIEFTEHGIELLQELRIRD